VFTSANSRLILLGYGKPGASLGQVEDSMAGYSGTPLIKKLGIKEGFRVVLVNSPKGFQKELSSLPHEARFAPCGSDSSDVIVLFVNSEAELRRKFALLAVNTKAKNASKHFHRFCGKP